MCRAGKLGTEEIEDIRRIHLPLKMRLNIRKLGQQGRETTGRDHQADAVFGNSCRLDRCSSQQRCKAGGPARAEVTQQFGGRLLGECSQDADTALEHDKHGRRHFVRLNQHAPDFGADQLSSACQLIKKFPRHAAERSVQNGQARGNARRGGILSRGIHQSFCSAKESTIPRSSSPPWLHHIGPAKTSQRARRRPCRLWPQA